MGWGVAFVDLDDDGWKDLIIANGHVYPEVDRSPVGDRYLQKTLLYRNLGNGRFEDITREAGPALAVDRPARGLAVGDVDGDGRPEIVIVNMNSTPSLLKNTGPRRNFLSLTLAGTKSNRSAIGARVTVEANGRRQIDEVMSGGSFYSQNDLSLYFGLGQRGPRNAPGNSLAERRRSGVEGRTRQSTAADYRRRDKTARPLTTGRVRPVFAALHRRPVSFAAPG